MRRLPKRIAHIHLMRTAGTTVSAYLGDVLSQTGYKVFNSWFDGLGRDWNASELTDFCEFDTSMYVHNHVRNWTPELVNLYQERGFFVFSFVRPLGDQLCSLYHWIRERSESDFKVSLDQFVQEQLRGEMRLELSYRDWAIPDYWSQLDFVDVFTLASFHRLVQEKFAQPWDSTSEWIQSNNSSQNSGYESYRRQGLVSHVTQQLLADSIYQRRFEAIRQRSLVIPPARKRTPTQGTETDYSDR